MTESRTAYERASQLDKKVAEHIDRIPGQRVLATLNPAAASSATTNGFFSNALTASGNAKAFTGNLVKAGAHAIKLQFTHDL